jgi:hypothetical protein
MNYAAFLSLLSLLALTTVAEPLHFRRADTAWGLDFHHHSASSGRYYMVETNGGGVVLFDYDDDGDLDVFFADGALLPGYEGPPPRSRLYRNEGGQQFKDVTEQAGIALDVYASGGAAGDVDNDGDLDLYITAFGPNRLFLNRGDGTFQAVEAGVEDPLWGSSAAFADVDRDGDLDLYVANYVDFRLDHNIRCGDQKRGLRGYCGPDVYNPEPNRLFRNHGEGTFQDATSAAGLGEVRGAGLAVAFGDLDKDGWPDLYVANDLTPNFLFKNKGDGTFEDLSLLSGTAYGPRGTAEAGMGLALGDFDGDGKTDLVVSNYEGETNALYTQRGPLLFTDRRFASGLAEPTLRSLAFGTGAADFDHDGDLDLAFANGHVRENAELFSPLSRYRQANQIFENLGNGRFREATEAGLSHLAPSRGLAHGDLDGDGDLDLVITNVNEAVEVYENLLPPEAGAWIQVILRRSGPNQRGIGARILVAGDRQQEREIQAGASFMSQHSLTAHFGVAGATSVMVTIVTPEGMQRTLTRVTTSRRLVWMQ